MWLLFAFSGPVLWAASTHIDKYLVEKYFKNSDTAVLLVFTSFIGIFMLPFILIFEPSTLKIGISSVIVMVASGILYLWAMLFYLRAIQSAEASVIAPLFQLSIIFTFILGYVVLKETLNATAILGIIIIIAGVLSLSINKNLHFHNLSGRTFLMMVICTFILALSTIIFKFFAVNEAYWSTTFWTLIGEAIFGLGILAIPKYFKQFSLLLKTNTTALLGINGANELINLGGGLGSRFALLFAPAVLVSAISSTTTLFVFIFGIILTIFWPRLGREDLSRANLWRKGIAAMLVAIGVILTQV